MGFVSLYQCKKIVLVLVGFSFSVSRFLLTLFNLIASPLFRFKGTGISLKNDFDSTAEAIANEQLIKEESNLELEPNTEAENNDVGDSVKDVEEKLEFSFTFKFPTFDEFTISKKEKGELFGSDSVYSDTSRYEFTAGQSNPLSIKEPEVGDLDVKEIHGDLGGAEDEENEDIKQVDGDSIKVVSVEVKTEDFAEEIAEVLEKEHNFLGNKELPSVPGDLIKGVCDEEKTEDFADEIAEVLEKEHIFLGNQELPSVPEDLIKVVCDKEKTEDFADKIAEVLEKEHIFLGNQELPCVPEVVCDKEKIEDFADKIAEVLEKEHIFLGNKELPSVPEDLIKVVCDEEKTENSEPEDFTEEIAQVLEKEHNFLGNQELPSVPEHKDPLGCDTIDSHFDGFLSDGGFREESDYDALTEESMHFDEEDSQNIDHGEVSNSFSTDFLSENDFHEDGDNAKIETRVDNEKEDNKTGNGLPDSENTNLKDSYDFEDANKLDSLWEHQDLIEQLHMELRKARGTGLPTILEESECPKIVEDLKPLKIDEKFQHEECMDELQKFYKSYAERMKKLDIFSHQKMYTIGLLRLKDPLQPTSSQTTSGQMFKSMFPENFMQLKHKVNQRDPLEQFVKEIQIDLEVVYVGQMCLSWELLRWKYGKALDLWEYDAHGSHRYNEVAGEFQRFQILMQRFVEDEPFQGPRVQNYVRSRCVNRDLLQVPRVREDSTGSRNKRKGEGSEYVIASDQLVEIIEESIRILWRFIRADKETSTLISKGQKGSPVQLENPGDFELLKDIRNVLQKKEKKLKEMRSGNFISRRFRGSREEDSDQVLYNFFSQVDMKLIYRVLNMSKITRDQLVWCHTKLSRIYFEHRKLHVDSSFLPFPC